MSHEALISLLWVSGDSKYLVNHPRVTDGLRRVYCHVAYGAIIVYNVWTIGPQHSILYTWLHSYHLSIIGSELDEKLEHNDFCGHPPFHVWRKYLQNISKESWMFDDDLHDKILRFSPDFAHNRAKPPIFGFLSCSHWFSHWKYIDIDMSASSYS